MLRFLKRRTETEKNSEKEAETPAAESEKTESVAPTPEPNVKKADKPGLFKRLTQGLSRTRKGLTAGLANIVLGKKTIDDDLLETLETHLLTADVGVEATQAILKELSGRVARKQLNDSDALLQALQDSLLAILTPCQTPLVIPNDVKPYVILMVGINGAGKTTTIGKIAKQLQSEGKKVMLAAGDTFRAAAVEQLQVWGERNDIPVIAQQTGADSASVIFDTLQSAQARGIDVVIADTAGRLHTQNNLMEELKKIKRVMAKFDDAIPHEVMLVLDAGIGQNALSQASQFNEAVGVTGITVTKLDGTAKGGILFAICQQMGLPLRYIGVGEGIDDLRQFNANDFVDALFVAEDE